VGANIIGWSKKANVRPKKTAEPCSNGSLKEPLLNTPFNNGSKYRTIIKSSV
jgi:hypothetical protein